MGRGNRQQPTAAGTPPRRVLSRDVLLREPLPGTVIHLHLSQANIDEIRNWGMEDNEQLAGYLQALRQRYGECSFPMIFQRSCDPTLLNEPDRDLGADNDGQRILREDQDAIWMVQRVPDSDDENHPSGISNDALVPMDRHLFVDEMERVAAHRVDEEPVWDSYAHVENIPPLDPGEIHYELLADPALVAQHPVQELSDLLAPRRS